MPCCDLTKNISLPPEQHTLYAVARIVILLLFLGGIGYFLYTLFFPSAHLSYNSAIDSLANTIKKPLYNATTNITSFDAAALGMYDRAEVVIHSQEDLSGEKILIRKSYAAFLAPIIDAQSIAQPIPYTIDGAHYLADDGTLFPLVSKNAAESYVAQDTPITEMIDLSEATPISREVRGFSSGSLLSSQSGIYVIDGIKKHAIDDETTFLALGYDFDSVVKTDSEERSAHESGKIYTIAATHPANTYFATSDVNTFYHFDGVALRAVRSQNLIHPAIAVELADRSESAECVLSRSFFSSDRYTCAVPLENISDNHGNIYRFDVGGTPALERISVSLAASPERATIDRRITEVKKALKENFK